MGQNKQEENQGMSDEYFKETLLANEDIKGKSYHKLFNYLVNSLNAGYAPVIGICGRYGSGKSLSGLEIARILHNEIGVLIGELDPQKQLCYKVLDFLKLVDGNKRKFITMDDAGTALNSLDLHSSFSRAVVDTVSTQRFKENIYCFILGKLYKLNSRLRDILDVRLTVSRKAEHKPVVDVTIFKPKWGKIDSGGSNRTKVYLSDAYIPDMPPDDLKEKYRKKEMDFKHDILKEKIEEIEKEREKQKEKEQTMNF